MFLPPTGLYPPHPHPLGQSNRRPARSLRPSIVVSNDEFSFYYSPDCGRFCGAGPGDFYRLLPKRNLFFLFFLTESFPRATERLQLESHFRSVSTCVGLGSFFVCVLLSYCFVVVVAAAAAAAAAAGADSIDRPANDFAWFL